MLTAMMSETNVRFAGPGQHPSRTKKSNRNQTRHIMKKVIFVDIQIIDSIIIRRSQVGYHNSIAFSLMMMLNKNPAFLVSHRTRGDVTVASSEYHDPFPQAAMLILKKNRSIPEWHYPVALYEYFCSRQKILCTRLFRRRPQLPL